MAQNYYQTLGVSNKASPEEIQAAYRKLVAEVYPGVNRGETEANDRMKEINRAYETLKNKDKRSEYDQLLTPSAQKPAPRRNPGQPDAARQQSGGAASSGPSANMFVDAINNMRDQARTNAVGRSESSSSAGGPGTVVEIWLTPRQAVEGAEKMIKVDGKLIRLKIGIRR